MLFMLADNIIINNKIITCWFQKLIDFIDGKNLTSNS